MSATSYQRMRRVQELKEVLTKKGIEFDDSFGEAELREVLETAQVASDGKTEELSEDEDNEEKELRAKAKALGIKSWHVKSVNTLKEEIAAKEE